MNECFGKRFILNGELLSCENFENSMVYKGESVYEVIRIIRSVPVFFDDHFERLRTSAALQGKRLLADEQKLRKDIITLAKTSAAKEINLKIVFNYSGSAENYLLYFIESVYPSSGQYREGVKGILFRAERNDPASKVINHKLRSSISQRLILEGAYEALLVNNDGFITEGSRSNIFFLRKNTLFTAPDELVLCGITRKHILEICSLNQIEVRTEAIHEMNIEEFEAVFMTGTSPMVLPFSMLGDRKYSVKYTLIESLRELYIRRVGENIQEFRKRNDN